MLWQKNGKPHTAQRLFNVKLTALDGSLLDNEEGALESQLALLDVLVGCCCGNDQIKQKICSIEAWYHRTVYENMLQLRRQLVGYAPRAQAIVRMVRLLGQTWLHKKFVATVPKPVVRELVRVSLVAGIVSCHWSTKVQEDEEWLDDD